VIYTVSLVENVIGYVVEKVAVVVPDWVYVPVGGLPESAVRHALYQVLAEIVVDLLAAVAAKVKVLLL
jgi:hypothetical protein